MKKLVLLAAVLLITFSNSHVTRADQSASLPTGLISAPRPATLDSALAAAEQPQHQVYIAVGADRVTLPSVSKALPLTSPTSVDDVAAAYGRIVVACGSAVAVASPTRVILNTNPPKPNPYDGMPPSDAFTLLVARLTQAEWLDLIGNIGLSYQDLSTDDQRVLFAAMFPNTPLHLYHNEMRAPGEAANPDRPTVSAEALKAAHLRLGKRYSIGIPIIGKPEWTDVPFESEDGTPTYSAEVDYAHTAPSVYGAALTATVPNTPKDSDLDYGSSALRAWINLNSLVTVADLVERIALTSHLEIYADPHYEARRLTVLGPNRARCSDLLQALALCVAGAYRRVGPAYVLTDDLTGAGARRSIVNRFTEQADMGRKEALTNAEDYIYTAHHGLDGIGFLSGDTETSPAEDALMAKQRAQPSFIPGGPVDIHPSLSEMTKKQIAAATKFKERWEETFGLSDPEDNHLTLDQNMILSTGTDVEMDVPGLDAPVEMGDYLSPGVVLRPSNRLYNAIIQKQAGVAGGDQPKLPDASVQTVAGQLKTIDRRALLASPKAASDVDSIIASMKAVGLNQLWLDIFSNGRSRLTMPPGSKSNDILTEALSKGQAAGITIIPTIDVLLWGPDAPIDARDLTVTGENSAAAQHAEDQYMGVMHAMVAASGGANASSAAQGIYVSPAAPDVRSALAAFIHTIASRPGIGGIVLRYWTSNGYSQDPTGRYNQSEYTLGYTLPMRLAFLRRSHEDPIDLDPEMNGGQVRTDTSLPDYDDFTVSSTVQARWDEFRTDADQALLQALWTSAQSASDESAVPVLMRSNTRNLSIAWYGQWAGPRTPLPTVPTDRAPFGGLSPADLAAIAGSTTRTNLIEMPVEVTSSLGWFSTSIQLFVPGWSGFVIDGSGSASADPIAELAHAFTGAKATDTLVQKSSYTRPNH